MNLFCGKLFHSGQRIRTIIPFGLKYDRLSYSPLCSLAAVLQSLKRVSNALSWCTNIPMHNVHDRGCTASTTSTGKMDRNSTGVL